MKAIVHSIGSADVDVASYVSQNPECDGIWLRLVVGPEGGSGEESFDVLVCTPLWLRRVVEKEGPQVGRHRLIVDPLDLAVASQFLKSHFEAIEDDDWSALCERFGRIGYWEFEDYRK
ncbi:immunity 8 family protein [Microbacterium sp. Au-Mic1]|uniref:Imm8 family immunity protein n=1 Tax=Microbacterium sp. Au-Mic1 TaxID=2906457 RepID=UPI001E2CC52F|nr:Imm8 family immunity protein [Microbacterium sp. Au-Mic1]MCE4026913.1 immunity 8 family protein [Microbacterium sp. Au-Mic1]